MRPPAASGSRVLTALVLALGIAAVSTASVFVRFAQHGAPSLVIAAGRLALATLVLAPAAVARHRAALARLGPGDAALALLAGALLALHFASWIASLESTSVMSSVVLVTTTPLWVAALAPFVLRERPAAVTWLGIAIALAGAAAIGASDSGAPAVPATGTGARAVPALRGDLLALLGAWAMAGYLLAGRRLRSRLALVPYVFPVYGMAALVLCGALAWRGLPARPIPPAAWGWIALLALVPQLLGHSSFNWALRHLPATFVSVALLGEPVGSTVLAWLVLGETPGALKLLGAGMVLAGIVLAARSEWARAG